MKQGFDRSGDILLWSRPYMEERIRESCTEIEKKLKEEGVSMWKELRGAVQEVLARTADRQEQNRKGKAAYLVCSFLQRSVYLNKLLLRLEIMDEGFYLDERETAGYYRLQMLEERYREDLEFLHQKVCKEWIRVQDHELDEVDKEYTEYYNAVVSMIVQSVSGLLMDVVEGSEVRLADTFQIVYGQYMGNATVVYARGKNEDGIFTD